jgi:hypothetical protein
MSRSGFNRGKGELRERYKVLASMRGGQSPQVRETTYINTPIQPVNHPYKQPINTCMSTAGHPAAFPRDHTAAGSRGGRPQRPGEASGGGQSGSLGVPQHRGLHAGALIGCLEVLIGCFRVQ